MTACDRICYATEKYAAAGIPAPLDRRNIRRPKMRIYTDMIEKIYGLSAAYYFNVKSVCFPE